jgi:hypothetical protein
MARRSGMIHGHKLTERETRRRPAPRPQHRRARVRIGRPKTRGGKVYREPIEPRSMACSALGAPTWRDSDHLSSTSPTSGLCGRAWRKRPRGLTGDVVGEDGRRDCQAKADGPPVSRGVQFRSHVECPAGIRFNPDEMATGRTARPPAGRPPTTRVDASSSCPSWEDAAACMVGRSTNRHRDITTDLKRPSFCGVTRAVRLPRCRFSEGRDPFGLTFSEAWDLW